MTSNLDDAFNALANTERRRLLLADDTPRQDPSVDPVETDRGRRLRTSNVHLPVLEAPGVIERRNDDRGITGEPKSDEFRPPLQVVDEKTEQVGATDGI